MYKRWQKLICNRIVIGVPLPIYVNTYSAFLALKFLKLAIYK